VLVIFVLYPKVTNVAFEGFPCFWFEPVGNAPARGWLRADVSIECNTPEHDSVRLLAWAAVLVYPIGMWFGCFALLQRASTAIFSGKMTPFSRSVAFLYEGYNVPTFWWELMEMLRKFLLIGLFVTVEPGTILQIALGTVVSAAYVMIQLKAQPYKGITDDALAQATSFCLLMFFFCCVIYKYDSLMASDDLQVKMSSEQRDNFIVPDWVLSTILLHSVWSSLLVAGGLVVLQIATDVKNNAKLRRLKYVETGLWVECKPLADPREYHLFLSHAWPAAQDRMRAVKARLLECLPSCRTFLDVDDLKSGSGSVELDKSGCVLVFCISSYFEKLNSLKQLFRAVCQGKYILAMLEPDVQQGGLNQVKVQALITNAKLDKFQLRAKFAEWSARGTLLPAAFDRSPDENNVRSKLFKTPPVEWNRLPHFQDVTIRLIAQRGVFHGTAPPSASRIFTLRGFFASRPVTKESRASIQSRVSRRASFGAPIAAVSELYLQDETACAKVLLPPPLNGRKYHLFCSEFNTGALELAEELSDSDVFVTKGKKVSAVLTFTTDVRKLADCDHMLVLLDERTWTSGADTAKFVEHIHSAMRIGVHITCVHELPSVVGPHRHACDFTMMVHDDWTPAHLLGGQTNLYKEMDVALKGEEWREPGLVALANEIATSAREHKRIIVRVPASYEPKTGANPWAEADGALSDSDDTPAPDGSATRSTTPAARLTELEEEHSVLIRNQRRVSYKFESSLLDAACQRHSHKFDEAPQRNISAPPSHRVRRCSSDLSLLQGATASAEGAPEGATATAPTACISREREATNDSQRCNDGAQGAAPSARTFAVRISPQLHAAAAEVQRIVRGTLVRTGAQQKAVHNRLEVPIATRLPSPEHVKRLSDSEALSA